MKTIVSIQEISEFEIKPEAAVSEWRRLVREEIAQRWADQSKWTAPAWPVGTREQTAPAFERDGFTFVESTRCGSLYAARRPTEKEMWAWYREARPSVYWREKILPASEAARQEKILRPRADWILAGIAEYHREARRIVDLSPHGRYMLSILADEGPALSLVAAGATADLEGAPTSRIAVRPTPTAEVPALGPVDIVIAMDALNRAVDLGEFVAAIERTLRPGGLLFATAMVASGFEIQTLWDQSPSIIPPDKLNLPSVDALHALFGAPKWEILELSTPGMFDVEVVRQTMKAKPAQAWPRVVRSLVERTDAPGRLALVELLQARRLTSFARLVVRKLS